MSIKIEKSSRPIPADPTAPPTDPRSKPSKYEFLVGKSPEISESVEGQSPEAIVAQFKKLGCKDVEIAP